MGDHWLSVTLQGGFVKLRGQQVVSRSPEMFQ